MGRNGVKSVLIASSIAVLVLFAALLGNKFSGAEVVNGQPLSLQLVMVSNTQRSTASITIKNNSASIFSTTPFGSRANHLVVVQPDGRPMGWSTEVFVIQPTEISPGESITVKEVFSEVLKQRRVKSPGLYRLYWVAEPITGIDSFKLGQQFNSNDIYLWKDSGRGNTWSGKVSSPLASEEALSLKVAAVLDEPSKLAFIATNTSVSAVSMQPVATNDNRVVIIKPDGQADEHFVQQDRVQSVSVKPSESMIHKVDIAAIMKSRNLVAPGLYRIVWKIGENKSNEMLLLKEKAK